MTNAYGIRKFLTPRGLLTVLITATCCKVWLGPVEVVPVASAQIPDSGLQRKQMIDEIRQTNLLLTQALDLLQKHTFKVRLEGTDNSPAPKR